jgi:hypothetical protein
MSSAKELAPPIVVDVRPKTKGRATVFEVSCSEPEHGVFPLDCATKKAGLVVAHRHAMHEHGGKAKVRASEHRRRRAAR